MLSMPISNLSGGWKMKLALVRAMLQKVDILLLDEPTNHLDVKNVAWLEEFLVSQDQITSIIVSHDSGFLNNVVQAIIHYEHFKLKKYVGNMAKFISMVPSARSYQDIATSELEFTFPEPGYLEGVKTKQRAICRMKDIEFQYEGTSAPQITNVSLQVSLSSRIAVIGPNGAGKSTLIKVLCVILTDDQTNPRSIPTKQNIIAAMQWLVKDARPNDSFFLHYSGHGGQIDDIDGDEEDGNDEVIYPVDFNCAGYITDDMIHNILVRPLPPGCRLTAIFDCSYHYFLRCHSGSIMDLPFTYRSKLEKASHAEVIMFSGCKDSQTSVDTCIRNQATGAMSWAFRNALTKIPNQTYLQLLNSIRNELYQKYDQKPQLSCSHPIDLNRLFVL
ncbi:hypothetical protein PCK2_000578 [Pneumocystis canis]|nr:hypothetical protein PCK2_000578 [Pneumocystis canis]